MKTTKKMFAAILTLAAVMTMGLGSNDVLAHGYCEGGYCKVNQTASVNGITLDEAKGIAFRHAKVTASDVIMKKAKIDYEHGRKVYEIEFYVGNMEYEYDIDATTGNIVKYDREYDRHH